uniref:Uncharacterized protein n=1 Tax=Candidatus Kentrum sp. MB TaxID=2138164 RepID=A0A450XPZ6_9GAMM|nr:MAG: hypothetical protein BECKMB1821G_GA0114241_102520 [Candidatus Kentron sp. MB]VFK31403.1 MAG: hypothetical protein BECKMB1821I_GA0114274_102320 [Candidatus Kentron sp. MB]VFK75468.1 MAG: hypothetical protein BECKMB1821H_GA0114242_102320 [Candidatus Kentron sp. MB]
MVKRQSTGLFAWLRVFAQAVISEVAVLMIRRSLIQTLASEHNELAFSHVELSWFGMQTDYPVRRSLIVSRSTLFRGCKILEIAVCFRIGAFTQRPKGWTGFPNIRANHPGHQGKSNFPSTIDRSEYFDVCQIDLTRRSGNQNAMAPKMYCHLDRRERSRTASEGIDFSFRSKSILHLRDGSPSGRDDSTFFAPWYFGSDFAELDRDNRHQKH